MTPKPKDTSHGYHDGDGNIGGGAVDVVKSMEPALDNRIGGGVSSKLYQNTNESPSSSPFVTHMSGDPNADSELGNKGSNHASSFSSKNFDDLHDIKFDIQDGMDGIHTKAMPQKRDCFWVWMIFLTMVFFGLLGYGFASGLFMPGGPVDASSDGPNNPQGGVYYEQLLEYFGNPLLEPTSPQIQAMNWLAFEDVPFDLNSEIHVQQVGSRLDQRYALLVWYFGQGGPKLWSTINNDPAAGWVAHGAKMHECDWRGIDCVEKELVAESGVNTKIVNERVVTGVRLRPTLGVILTGTSLNTELGMLTNLRRFEAADQRLVGSIPDEWRSVTNLEVLNLSNNNLQTTIPSWIGEWSNLRVLGLGGNSCSGSLPSSFSTLKALQDLQLQGNIGLRGRFDEVMIAIPSLEYLDVSNTGLEGSLPGEASMGELRVFNLWNTRLTGTIPPEIGTWSSLESFSLGEVPRFEGSIPTEMGLLSNLKTFEIKLATAMVGTLPTELGQLTNLSALTLSFSNFQGTLPVEYSNLLNLEVLDVRVNDDLTGSVPTEYGRLEKLEFFDIRATSLTGSISDEVCALSIDSFLSTCSVVCECCRWCESV